MTKKGYKDPRLREDDEKSCEDDEGENKDPHRGGHAH